MLSYSSHSVTVGRDTTWGNPFRLGQVCRRCGDFHEAPGSTLPCYKAWVLERLAADPLWLEPLVGRKIQCPGCKPDSPVCHVTVLRAMLDNYVAGRAL